MLINTYHDSPKEHRRLEVAGVVFLLVMALLVGLSIAIYGKAFTRTTTVTVTADRAGQQLPKLGDVRMRGARVGYVEDVDSDGDDAVITLALRPKAAETIPADVNVRIIPTTLFGQKFVELVPPEGAVAGGPTIRDGATIGKDRVETNVELQQILANLFPLLRSVRPADLNATLYALSNALEGQGDKLGDTMVDLRAYLQQTNPALPDVQTDLQLLADVADTYDMAAPDLLAVLRNATVTARTVTEREGDLAQTLTSLTRASRTTRATLDENEDQLIAQGRRTRPLLALLDTYSPEIPCVLRGLFNQIPDGRKVFQDGKLRQQLVLGQAPARTGYTAEDAPVYGEIGTGPRCLGLPNPPSFKGRFVPLDDGTDKDEPGGGLP